jgi:hypothetical protein
MLRLEEVISEQLEAEGHVLAKKVAQHMLMCFQSFDPNASLEPVTQGPTVEAEEMARASVQDTTLVEKCIRFPFQLLRAPETFVSSLHV